MQLIGNSEGAEGAALRDSEIQLEDHLIFQSSWSLGEGQKWCWRGRKWRMMRMPEDENRRIRKKEKVLHSSTICLQ